MPRPYRHERRFDEAEYGQCSRWPAILLASPVGLLVAMIVLTELRTSTPSVREAAASVPSTVAALPPDRTTPATPVPADAGTVRADGPTEAAREPRRVVSAGELQALISDPAIRAFTGLSENAWDFSRPAGIPGFGPYRGADDRPAPGEFKLTSDQ